MVTKCPHTIEDDTIIFDFSDDGSYGYRLGMTPEDIQQNDLTVKEIFFPFNLHGKGYFDYWDDVLRRKTEVLGCPIRNLEVQAMVTTKVSQGAQIDVFSSMKRWLTQNPRYKKAIFICSRVPTALHKEIKKGRVLRMQNT